MRRLPINGFLNCYELDEQRQQQQPEKHYPNWLENDESDDLIFEPFENLPCYLWDWRVNQAGAGKFWHLR